VEIREELRGMEGVDVLGSFADFRGRLRQLGALG
jgi:hypothetical protein